MFLKLKILREKCVALSASDMSSPFIFQQPCKYSCHFSHFANEELSLKDLTNSL